MACGICATAGWQPSNWVAGRGESQPKTQCSVHRVASQRWRSIGHSEKRRRIDKANKELSPWQVARCFAMWRDVLSGCCVGVCVNNPWNAKFPNPHLFLQLHLLLFWGFARLFFHRNYFTSSTATLYRIHSCHGNIWARKKKKKKLERTREGREGKKREKVFTVDREITGFIIRSQMIPSITIGSSVAELCMSSDRLLLGSRCCGPRLLIKWAQTDMSEIPSRPSPQETKQTNPWILIKVFFPNRFPAVYPAKAFLSKLSSKHVV